MPSLRDTSLQLGLSKPKLVQFFPSSLQLIVLCSENALSVAILPVLNVLMASNSRDLFAKDLAKSMKSLVLMVSASAPVLTKMELVSKSAHQASIRKILEEPMRSLYLLNIFQMTNQ